MKLVKMSKEEQKRVFEERGAYKKTKLFMILDEFAKGDETFVKVEWEPGEYTNVKSVHSSLYASNRTFGFGVKIHLWKDSIYLEKKG